jgi:hypothetical protein
LTRTLSTINISEELVEDDTPDMNGKQLCNNRQRQNQFLLVRRILLLLLPIAAGKLVELKGVASDGAHICG